MTSTLNVNVFTAPEKAIVGERPRPWGPPMAWDATTSTLILHHRNLATIYITHMHIDHYGGLSVLLRHGARAL